jgi:hypothetical protein
MGRLFSERQKSPDYWDSDFGCIHLLFDITRGKVDTKMMIDDFGASLLAFFNIRVPTTSFAVSVDSVFFETKSF